MSVVRVLNKAVYTYIQYSTCYIGIFQYCMQDRASVAHAVPGLCFNNLSVLIVSKLMVSRTSQALEV